MNTIGDVAQWSEQATHNRLVGGSNPSVPTLFGSLTIKLILRLPFFCVKQNMRKYRHYTEEDLINAVKKSKSIAEILRSLDLRQAGGNFNTIKIKIAKLNLDTSHFTGQLWSKGERIKEWASFKRVKNFRSHLIKQKGHKCEKCLQSIWFGDSIPLEVHHIDGNRTNNSFENLQLLCCNCHATTDNWRNKKRKAGMV